LAAAYCANLGDFLDDMKELKYLRLGVSAASLPESVTKLTKLRTLDLRPSNILVLPTRFHKLTQLRHLYTGDRLIDLPPEFGELTSLQKLDVFKVGENNKLEALNKLNGLVGNLKVRYMKYTQDQDTLKGIAKISRDLYLSNLSVVCVEKRNYFRYISFFLFLYNSLISLFSVYNPVYIALMFTFDI
jgi:Leucine-rich repeat (LRR) protein